MTENLNRNPLVSVIIPVFNCVKYVDQAIESVVNQTYANLEIFIIDDCSTDGTREKVESWANLDNRIKPIYKTANSGYVNSLNMAIGLSNGEYIARMDGDDISLPDRIKKQVEYMRANLNIGVLGCGYRFLGTNKILVPVAEHDKIKIGLLLQSQLAHPTVMFRASTIKNLERLYRHEFIPCEDYEFWVYLSSKTVLHNLEDILLEYRVHEANISKNNKRNKILLKEINKIQLEILGLNIDEINAIDLQNIVSNKKLNKKLIEIFEILNIFRKVIINNRKFKIYNIEYFESALIAELKIKVNYNQFLNFLVKIYIKYLFRNFAKRTNLKWSSFNYFFKLDNKT